MSGFFEKLRIAAYYSHDYTELLPGGYFEAYFNPDSYTVQLHPEYCSKEGFGMLGSEMRFVRSAPKSYKFDLLIDGTGASGPPADVDEQIQLFMNLTYEVIGATHRPPYLVLSWGSLVANCVLESLNISYTLFDRSGKPLRAKLSCAFKEAVNLEVLQAIARLSSPDLTHKRVVKVGDTLPMMCKQIYGDAQHYQMVARANDLDDFRNLETGTEIYFPPLEPATS